ncbi:hypothetical protein HYALB_00011251 [Hymenoscyphus albidus]|uniref:Manganese lipoxygenase n=1 Tax=Hymenoscyphus albidus TaxID=595503 RepID=A0A9N9Q9T6_9HELO|nr:hypothetical protein HYALB_00011251 [Hymenoscyphus albidus]
MEIQNQMTKLIESVSTAYGIPIISLPGSRNTEPALVNVPLAKETLKLSSWDPAIFVTDVLRTQSGLNRNYEQTEKGLTVAYGKIMANIQSYFDVTGFEPSIAPERQLEDKKRLYQFTTKEGYPPHLALVPKVDEVTIEQLFQEGQEDPTQFEIAFNVILKNKLGFLGSIFVGLRPHPEEVDSFVASKSFAEINQQHESIRSKPGNLSKPSVGDLDSGNKPWYSDATFAQQSFTGTSPASITLAKDWIPKFINEARRQKLDSSLISLLEKTDPSSLYVQDYSYFRKAFGIADPKAKISDEHGFIFKKTSRWCCAAVVLYKLQPDGKLHPQAIVLDYKGSMEDSIVVFNKRLTPEDKDHDEEQDWPWRYAKTCAQVSDWVKHELKVHLNDCHLIEESIIVAAQRTIANNHVLYHILSPHWEKTLSLNAAARTTLVPSVIIPIIGATDEQCRSFIRYSYENFNFEESYVPADLKSRGFAWDKLGDLCCRCDKHCDIDKAPNAPCSVGCGPECHQTCDPQFKNYTYARNTKLMWITIRDFVEGYLATAGFTPSITGDAKVANDLNIQAWVQEAKHPNGANIKTFPYIKTVNQLIDAVTMCIHIASPQHTAVNYLQQYYLSFVPNKPPALCSELPRNLKALNTYDESDLIAALPVSRNRDAEWLLASHLPALLSQTVTKDLNFVAYAVNVYSAALLVNDKKLMAVAERFCRDLWVLGNTFTKGDDSNPLPKMGVFTQYSEELDEGFPGYTVMDPVVTAVSVLI